MDLGLTVTSAPILCYIAHANRCHHLRVMAGRHGHIFLQLSPKAVVSEDLQENPRWFCRRTRLWRGAVYRSAQGLAPIYPHQVSYSDVFCIALSIHHEVQDLSSNNLDLPDCIISCQTSYSVKCLCFFTGVLGPVLE